MRWHLHADVKANAGPGLEWVKAFLARFDTSTLGWIRIDFGREHRDVLGRRYRRFRGVYGRCWYPSASQPTVRISCQVPGPYPCAVVTRKKPVYRQADGAWPLEARQLRGPVIVDRRSGRAWKRVYGRTRLDTLDEGIVWIFAHEAFHWLRKTGQVPGRNNEVEADAFADEMLAGFRTEERVARADQAAVPQETDVGPKCAGAGSVHTWAQGTLAMLDEL